MPLEYWRFSGSKLASPEKQQVTPHLHFTARPRRVVKKGDVLLHVTCTEIRLITAAVAVLFLSY
uniref:Uncharacterized protein n=1 Tax=Romanomermis culicivorax TaxID=13658 RepID=A0A915KHN2_ROMCU